MKRKNLGTKLVAAGLTAALLLTGCGGNSSSGQATGSTGEGTTQSAGEEERPTITVAVSMNEKGEYSDANYAIKYIEDNTVVNIEFVQAEPDAVQRGIPGCYLLRHEQAENGEICEGRNFCPYQ